MNLLLGAHYVRTTQTAFDGNQGLTFHEQWRATFNQDIGAWPWAGFRAGAMAISHTNEEATGLPWRPGTRQA